MKDKTKEWVKAITSVLLFNLIIIILICWFNLVNIYTLSLKILLDITIAFVTDKSISRLVIGWKEGFCVERKINNPN